MADAMDVVVVVDVDRWRRQPWWGVGRWRRAVVDVMDACVLVVDVGLAAACVIVVVVQQCRHRAMADVGVVTWVGAGVGGGRGDVVTWRMWWMW